MLVNPTVAGLRVHRREPVGPGAWTPILERGKWERIRSTVADPARKRRRPARKYLLAGLVESAEGDRMNGKPETDGRTYYASRSTKDAKGNIVPARLSLQIDSEKLEAFVTEAVFVALHELHRRPRTHLTTAPARRSPKSRSRSPSWPPCAAGGRSAWPNGSPRGSRSRLRSLTPASALGRSTPQRPKVLGAADVRTAWGKASVDDRRKVVAAVVEKIVIGPDERAMDPPT